MKFKRSSGILLHPTSLPGSYGIGDIGPQAHKWLDFLAETECSLWQILPLGPTGYGDSPYQCFSAFAGNPYLISPEALLAEDLLHPNDVVEAQRFPSDRVDYGQVIPWKLGILDLAYNRFQHAASAELRHAFDAFQQESSAWLNDFAIFMALKEYHGGGSWSNWPAPLRDRQPQALAEISEKLTVAIQRQKFRQFIFFRQWSQLRSKATELGIQIIGDIPIFVAHDSADVWANPGLFYMDKQGNPTAVAGVPPDYFSSTGQLWGNPVYRWDVHKESGYSWWLDRLRGVLSLVDIVRLDHFRGFSAYWEVPAGMPTAELGRWAPGPGADFFNAVKNALGELPIIAEDLGIITQDVVDLRDDFDLPGMKVLQFAFSSFGIGPSDPFLPHNYVHNCVAYTGTHDNDTVRGWYERVEETERDFYRRYLGRDGHDVSWDFIRGVWGSIAAFSIAPMQDFLSLGNKARMNYPGNPSGNWSWRMPEGSTSDELASRLKEMNYLYSRGKPQEKQEEEIDEPDKA